MYIGILIKIIYSVCFFRKKLKNREIWTYLYMKKTKECVLWLLSCTLKPLLNIEKKYIKKLILVLVLIFFMDFFLLPYI
jgi:hypothetical protein